MDPLTYFIIWVGTMVLTAMLTKSQSIDPASAEDINLPMVTQSQRIPLVIGTGHVTGPNILGTGDLGSKKKKVSGGAFSGSKDSGVVNYYLDVYTGLAYGPGELLAVYMGSYDLGVTPTDTTSDEYLLKSDLWGSTKAGDGGGFDGYVRFNPGYPNGVIDTYAEAATGDIQPGYPGIATVLFHNGDSPRGCYMGNQATIKPISFKYAYYPNPFNEFSAHKIGGHANPAYFLYELNNNTIWGRDIRATVDIPAIQAMAATLVSEGFGWSRVFYDGNSSGMELEALQFVDGVRYRDPLTGNIIYKLIRDDFVVDNLPVLGDNEIADIYIDGEGISTVSTEVSITYVDVDEDFKRKTITRANTAARQQIGRRVPADMEFLGCPTGAIADKIATREARKLGVPKRKGKLWATRDAWDWANGDAFVINYTPENMSGVIARVVNIDRGNIVDVNGRVEIDWIEVPFVYSEGAGETVGSNPTVPLAGAPADVTNYLAFEVPDMLTTTPHKIGLFAVDPVGSSIGFDWQIDSASSGTFYSDSDGTFTEQLEVSATYNQQATTIIMDGEIIDPDAHTWADISVNGYNLMLLNTANGQEWIAYLSASYNSATNETTLTSVRRGLLDTYPKALVATDGAWEFSQANISANTFGSANDTDFKMLDITAQGTLLSGAATTRDFVLNNRYSRPFLPGYVRIDNALFPAAVVGPVTASWRHRDKTEANIRDWFDATSYGPEAGVQYDVKWYNNDTSALLQTTTTTGTTSGWDHPGMSYNIRLEIKAQNGGLDSYETFSFVTAFSQSAEITHLLHFNGTDASTNFTDAAGTTWSVVGNAQIDTAQQKFGSASGLFDGTGDYITTTYVPAFDNWWEADHTIECWVRAAAWTTWSWDNGGHIPVLFGNRNVTGTTNYWSFGPRADGTVMFYYSNGAAVRTIISTATLAVDTWHHIAMTVSAGTIKLWINGVGDTSAAIAGTPTSSAASPLTIGQGNGICVTGWVDELRVTKGEAKYTGDFIPSAVEFTYP